MWSFDKDRSSKNTNGPVAQWIRAPDYESGGRRFKSCRVRHFFLIFCFAIVLSSSSSFAVGTVLRLLTYDRLQFVQDSEAPVSRGRPVLIYSASGAVNGPLGYGVVETGKGESESFVRMKYFTPRGLILPGDRIVEAFFEKGSPKMMTGSVELLQSGERAYGARFKPLVFGGILVGNTAFTLDKNEMLLDLLGQVAYGVTDRFQVSTSALLAFLSIPNLALKYRFNPVKDYTVSPELTFGYEAKQRAFLAQSTLRWAFHSGRKWISHGFATIALTQVSDQQKDVSGTFFKTELGGGYEYILNSWHRIYLGPTFAIEQRSLGGVFAMIFVWDRIHFSIQLRTFDILKLRFGFDGYLPMLNLYWRF